MQPASADGLKISEYSIFLGLTTVKYIIQYVFYFSTYIADYLDSFAILWCHVH